MKIGLGTDIYTGMLGFDPSKISNLEIWLDAPDEDTISLRDSTDYVTDWTEKASGRNLSQTVLANQPTYTEQVNNKKVVTFDGLTQFMKYTTPFNIFGQPYTMFFVGTFGGLSQCMFSWYQGVLQGVDFAMSNITREVRFLHREPFGSSGGDNVTTSAVVYYNTPYVMMAKRDASKNMEIRIDGVVRGQLAGSDDFFDTNGDGYVVGALLDTGGRYLDGQVGEVLIYGKELISPEISQVQNYLSIKWGK